MFSLIYALSFLAQTGGDELTRFNSFLLLGYGVMWLVAVVYLITVANKQRNLQQDIRLMRRLLEEDEGDNV